MGLRNGTRTSSISIAMRFIYYKSLIISNCYTNGKTWDTQGGEILKTHSQLFPDVLVFVHQKLFPKFESPLWSHRKVLFTCTTHPDCGTLLTTRPLLSIYD